MTKREKNPVYEAIEQLCDGNVGAISVVLSLMGNTDLLLPGTEDQLFFPNILNEHELYGREIYMIYRFVCQKNIPLMALFLLSVDTGNLSASNLKEQAEAMYMKHNDKPPHDIIISGMLEMVKEKYPQFRYVKQETQEEQDDN
jgi:hypothetical protein